MSQLYFDMTKWSNVTTHICGQGSRRLSIFHRPVNSLTALYYPGLLHIRSRSPGLRRVVRSPSSEQRAAAAAGPSRDKLYQIQNKHKSHCFIVLSDPGKKYQLSQRSILNKSSGRRVPLARQLQIQIATKSRNNIILSKSS